MIRTLVFAAALATVSPTANAAPQSPAMQSTAMQSKAPSDNACFNLINMQNDLPIDDHTVLFRVNVSDIYALDFANKCPELTYPNPKLIIVPAGGMTFICHAIDLDVRVGQNGGPGDIPVPCIPTGLRKLTPAEVAALPKKDIP